MNKQERLCELYDLAVSRGLAGNRKELARLSGVSYTSMISAFNGDEKYLTDSMIAKVVKAIDAELAAQAVVIAPEPTLNRVPLIPCEAHAGALTESADGVQMAQCEQIISPVAGVDLAITIAGDSMAPEYPNGAIALLKRVNAEAFIEWGKVYVLDTENGTIIKEVHRTENDMIIECHSLNTDPKYAPFTIHTAYIRSWWRVLMVMSRK